MLSAALAQGKCLLQGIHVAWDKHCLVTIFQESLAKKCSFVFFFSFYLACALLGLWESHDIVVGQTSRHILLG